VVLGRLYQSPQKLRRRSERDNIAKRPM